MRRILLVMLLAFTCCFPAMAQDMEQYQDVVDHSSSDTARLSALASLTEICPVEEIPQYARIAFKLADEMRSSASASENDFIEGQLLNVKINLAYYYCDQGQSSKCDSLSQLSSQMAAELGELSKQAAVHNNLGFFMSQRGLHEEALREHNTALDLATKANNTRSKALYLNNIAQIYRHTNALELSLDYLYRARRMYESLEDHHGRALTILNAASIHLDLENYEKHEELAMQGLAITREHDINLLKGDFLETLSRLKLEAEEFEEALVLIDSALLHLHRFNPAVEWPGALTLKAVIHQKLGSPDTALHYFDLAYDMADSLLVRPVQMNILQSRALLYRSMGDHDREETDLLLAHEVAKEMSALSQLASTAEELYKLYRDRGDMQSAFRFLEIHAIYEDSILSNKDRMHAIQKEVEFNYITQHTRDSLTAAKEKAVLKAQTHARIKEEENKRDRLTIIIVAVAVLGLFLLLAYVGKRRDNRLINLQKRQVEQRNEQIQLQHVELQEKNQEIMDSILYAQRMQRGMLPEANQMQEVFDDAFVLYLPKDQLSGDFYWMGYVEPDEGPRLKVFCVADCTGHGVPGALLSILGMTHVKLGQTDPNVNSPADAMNFLNHGLHALFEGEGEDQIRDGMDMIMAAYNPEAKELVYAAAKNPLYVVRRGELLVFEGNKHALGRSGSGNSIAFDNHRQAMEEGDMVYAFSDGYADQFGGEKGKKFKYRQFKELLVTISDRPVEEQKRILAEEFASWKEGYEQIDDVCIMGIRI